MEMSPYHPFRSAKARERFLQRYDMRAKAWPIASEPRTVDTPYGPTFVRVGGPDGAPPLVLLHGVSGNSLQWLPNIKALSERFRTYAVDGIYDCGRSVYTKTLRTPDDFVIWLDGLLTGLGLGGGIHLMGLSYGGWQASQYALAFPQRLAGIVLVAPVCTVQPLAFGWIWRAVLCMVPCRHFTKSFMFWLMKDLARKDEASRREFEQWVDDAFMAMRCFKPRSLVSPTVLEDGELKGLEVPALFMVGENEKIYSARKAIERLSAVAPRIRTELIPGAGHDLTIVQAEMVNRKVLDFLGKPAS